MEANNYWIESVREFHSKFEVDYCPYPLIPHQNRGELRKSLINEEAAELSKAIDEEDLVGIADGIADLIYVAIGTAHEYGLGEILDDIFREVHRSNMSKLHNGKVLKREDGKVIKSPDYSPADIGSIIERRMFNNIVKNKDV